MEWGDESLGLQCSGSEAPRRPVIGFLVSFGVGPNPLPSTLMQACPHKLVVVLQLDFVVWCLIFVSFAVQGYRKGCRMFMAY